MKKLQEVKKRRGSLSEAPPKRRAPVLKEVESKTEDEAHEQLANLVEEKVKKKKDASLKLLENKLTIFLQKIKKESKAKLEHA
ncbi:MAG: hypothetical protein WEB87_00855 [Bacteriovoracaceae bacterium]